MRSINALSFAPDARDWLANSRHPYILHVFDRACNLINERREVLSIVTPQIGNGPFNIVIEDDVLFSEHLHIQSPISIRESQLFLGNFVILFDYANTWCPRPNWERVHVKKDKITDRISKLQITNDQFPSSLSSALANGDISSCLAAARQLAGLGQGLTPSGDDFIMGAIHAVWIIHPFEVSSVLAGEIAKTAAPLTTSLSAAWLKSAGKGEAGILWHEFFDALISGTMTAIQESMEKILAVGGTSGADALAGFAGVFTSLKEKELTVYEDPSG
jgi:hypothetical protein